MGFGPKIALPSQGKEMESGRSNVVIQQIQRQVKVSRCAAAVSWERQGQWISLESEEKKKLSWREGEVWRQSGLKTTSEQFFGCLYLLKNLSKRKSTGLT